MKIFYGLEKFKKPTGKIVATIGVFDGVHLGHQKILKEVNQTAKQIDGCTLVITFHPHPLKITENIKTPILLISLQHRLKILSEFNIDTCLVINFGKNFLRMRGEEFVKNILFEKIGIDYLIIGSDFRLGKQQNTDKNKLRRLAKKYNFEIKVIKPVIIRGAPVKSTKIRNLIEQGNLRQAAMLLDRLVTILGTVIKGDTRGRNLGYPTANIDAHQEIIPPCGVYAVKVKLPRLTGATFDMGFCGAKSRTVLSFPGKNGTGAQGKINNNFFDGILNIGKRPTFIISDTKKDQPNVEVHIFEFNRYIYGEDILIEFISKIRNEKKFSTKEKLIKQIEKDEIKARSILNLKS